MRSRYRKLGLEFFSFEDNFSHIPKKPSMVGENKYYKTRDPLKNILEESLE
jgi:hypothetical protein